MAGLFIKLEMVFVSASVCTQVRSAVVVFIGEQKMKRTVGTQINNGNILIGRPSYTRK